MKRRTFFKSALAAFLPLLPSRWVRAHGSTLAEPEVPGAELEVFRAIARVVLPIQLGAAKQDEVAAQFAQWIRNYREGADMNSGYGITRLQWLPENPARKYTEQIKDLDLAAKAAGGTSFTKMAPYDRKSLIEQTLLISNIERLPTRPDGKNIAADIMSFYFFSSEGQDFLYNAQIRREDCRGMKSSVARPAAWEA